LADYYSAECHRDYELALKNGFRVNFFQLIQMRVVSKKDVFQRNSKTSNDRNQIIAKCYGGEFGLGKLVIDAMDDYLNINK
jgi:hypothetical protein